MSPREVLNESKYLDRTFQRWHRRELGDDATAIDIDLLGYCRKCYAPLWFAESAENPNKVTRVVQEVAQRCESKAILVVHSLGNIHAAHYQYPRRVTIPGGADGLKAELIRVRSVHRCAV